MSAMSNYLENMLVDFVFRGQAPVLPGSLFVALFSTASDDANGGSELPVANGYARAPAPRSLAAWAGTQGAGTTAPSSGSSGQTSNNVSIVFGAVTGTWPAVTHFAIFDSAVGGNRIAHGSLGAPKSFVVGDIPEFQPGTLVATFS